jgi:hypothetical protein
LVSAVLSSPADAQASRLLKALFHNGHVIQYSSCSTSKPTAAQCPAAEPAKAPAAGGEPPSGKPTKQDKETNGKASSASQASASAMDLAAGAAGYTVRQMSRAARRGLDQVRGVCPRHKAVMTFAMGPGVAAGQKLSFLLML